MAQKQTCGSMEQNREPRNKPTRLQGINLQKKEAKIYSGKKTISSASSVEKAEQPHANQ